MKKQGLYKALTSRLALNIYFWVFEILLEFGLNFYGRRGQYYYAQGWYWLFRAVTIALTMAVVYTNNLWLVPAYFVKKRYRKYLLYLLPVTYAAGFCFAAFFDMLHAHFPKMQMEDVSLFMAMRIGADGWWVIFIEAFSWMITLLIITAMFTIAWYMQDYSRQKRISEEAQRKQVETELNFLKSQINPHFLFNTLNNLYTLTLKKSDNAPEVVSKLSAILRYLLYESNVKEVSFDKEKEIMEAYIDLELLRLANKENLNFTINADGTYNIPPLLWVPVLENVFKHGTRFISKDYFIDYQFSINNSVLDIRSKNYFKKDASNNLEKAGGIGLSNLQKRLSLLFPAKHTISNTTEDNYYITHIQIKLA